MPPASLCVSTCDRKTGTLKATSQACPIGYVGVSPKLITSGRFVWLSCAAKRSLNQMHDLGVREGVEVDIALRVDRVRVFSDPAAKRAA